MTTTSLLSVSDVAERLGVERKRIFRLVRNELIPVTRVGWVYAIDEADLAQVRAKLGLVDDSKPLEDS